MKRIVPPKQIISEAARFSFQDSELFLIRTRDSREELRPVVLFNQKSHSVLIHADDGVMHWTHLLSTDRFCLLRHSPDYQRTIDVTYRCHAEFGKSLHRLHANRSITLK